MESLYLDERFTSPSIFKDVVVCEQVCPYDLHCVIHQTEEIPYRKIDNLKQHYQQYKYQYCAVLGAFLSEWHLKPHGFGRIHSHLTLSTFHRPTRHALSKKYVDFDMVNCNYSIILNLMKKNGFPHSSVEYYCKNRKAVLAETMRVSKCTKDEAKEKFIKISMGACEMGSELFNSIQIELDFLFREIRKQNPHLPKGDKKNSDLSYYFTSIERYLQEQCIKMIHEDYKVPLHTIIPCQDGFMILQDYYQDDMLSKMNEFEVEWIIKPFDEACELKPTTVPYKKFDISNYRDAEYADMLLELELPQIISCGTDKPLDSYKFNGTYWENIAIHNADFYLGCFKKLQSFLDKQIALFIKAVITQYNYKSPKEMKILKETRKLHKTKFIYDQKQKYAEFKKREKEFKMQEQCALKQFNQEKKEFEMQEQNALKQFNQEKKEFEKTEKDRLKIYENKKKVAEKANIEFTEEFQPKEWNQVFQPKKWNQVFEPKQFTEVFQEDSYDEENEKCESNEEVLKTLKTNQKEILVLSSNKSMENIIDIVLKSSHKKIEWNKNPYLFVFENCVWDIKLKQQVKPCKEQFMNMSCGYAYMKPENCDEVNAFIQSVFPDKNLLTYYLKKQATMLTQEHPQYLFVQTGAGQNGKSVLSDLTKVTLGNYGYKINAVVLQSSQKVGACPELANLRDKRGVWFSEPSAEVRLCSNTIKELTGDREIQARGLYKSDTCVKLNFTLSGDTNAFPLLDAIDGGISRRIVPIPFEAIAVSQEDYDKAEDKSLIVVKQLKFETERWHTENRIAMFHVLLDAYEFEFDFSNMPEKCKAKKENYLQSSSDIYSFIQESFTEDKDKFVKLKDIYTAYKGTSVFRAMKKESQRGLNLSTFKEKLKMDSSLKKNIVERDEYFKGIQMKSDVLIGWTQDEKEPDDI
jgi:P4 family phage/plasmid primase-like protien